MGSSFAGHWGANLWRSDLRAGLLEDGRRSGRTLGGFKTPYPCLFKIGAADKALHPQLDFIGPRFLRYSQRYGIYPQSDIFINLRHLILKVPLFTVPSTLVRLRAALPTREPSYIMLQQFMITISNTTMSSPAMSTSRLYKFFVDEGPADGDDDRFRIRFNDRLNSGFDDRCNNVRHPNPSLLSKL
jgi:hypothetical protein